MTGIGVGPSFAELPSDRLQGGRVPIKHPECKRCRQAMGGITGAAQSHLVTGDPLPSPAVLLRTFFCKSCKDQALDVYYCVHHQETELRIESAKTHRAGKRGGLEREIRTEYRCTELGCDFRSIETRRVS